MKNVSGRICVVCSVAITLAAATATQASTFTIKPITLNPTCVAGANLGLTCARDSQCESNRRCVAGPNIGASCSSNADCASYQCVGDGDGVCEGTEITFTCVGGATPGAPCSSSADCGAGKCGPDTVHEVAYLPTCYSIDPENPVPNDGQPCDENVDCESTPGARDGFCLGDYTIKLADGDVIITEIYGSDWAPMPPVGEWPDDACRSYLFDIDVYSFMNGECDPAGVFPWRWDRPLDQLPCATNLDCPAQYPICDPLVGICIGPNHAPEKGFFIDYDNPNFIFYGLQTLPAEDYTGWRAGAAYIQPSGAEPLYQGVPKYLATMTFKVSTNACGEFTIPFVIDGLNTQMKNPFFSDLLPFVVENLVVQTGIVPSTVIATDPPNCDIDAGQTREPDVAGAQGWDTFVFYFEETDDLSGVQPFNFALRGVPVYQLVPAPPAIDYIDVDNVGKTVTVYLTKPIDPKTSGRWTCIEWRPRGQEFCWGYLPGDVTNDRATAQNDIGAIINHLVNPDVYPLGLHQCDIDRSGACTGADLLRMIDLFQGGDPYVAWKDTGAGLGFACPSFEPAAKRSRTVR